MLKLILSLTLITVFIPSIFANSDLDGRWVMDDKARCALTGKVARNFNKNTMTRRVRIEGNHMFYGYLTLDKKPVRMNFDITDLSSNNTFGAQFLDGDVKKDIYFGQLNNNGTLYLLFADTTGEFCDGGLIVTSLGKI